MFFLGGWGVTKRTIAFKSSIDLLFHPLIIEFFWFAYLWFRTEEKIHTKVALKVSRGRWDLSRVRLKFRKKL